MEDPLPAVLERVRVARDFLELRRVIHADGQFAGLSDAETTTSTVIQWLHDIVADRRDHIEVGADSQFSLRHLIPYPFRVAIQTVALSEGWPAEGLALAVASNVGWLEHPATRIRQRVADEHQRSPNIGIFHGMDPSLGKSSLKRYVTTTVLQGDCIDANIKEGIAVCSDGTLKGHRTSLENISRSGIETDEVTTAYHCGSGPDSTTRGMHFASREKLCTFVNGERDSCLTGHERAPPRGPRPPGRTAHPTRSAGAL